MVVVTLLVPGSWTLDLVTLLVHSGKARTVGYSGHGDSGTAAKNEELGGLALQFNMTLFWQLGWSPVGLGRWRERKKMGLPNKKN